MFYLIGLENSCELLGFDEDWCLWGAASVARKNILEDFGWKKCVGCFQRRIVKLSNFFLLCRLGVDDV